MQLWRHQIEPLFFVFEFPQACRGYAEMLKAAMETFVFCDKFPR